MRTRDTFAVFSPSGEMDYITAVMDSHRPVYAVGGACVMPDYKECSAESGRPVVVKGDDPECFNIGGSPFFREKDLNREPALSLFRDAVAREPES